jgi:hypothetical protein
VTRVYARTCGLGHVPVAAVPASNWCYDGGMVCVCVAVCMVVTVVVGCNSTELGGIAFIYLSTRRRLHLPCPLAIAADSRCELSWLCRMAELWRPHAHAHADGVLKSCCGVHKNH